MIDKELEQTGGDQPSDIERLRNLLMQAQQDSFTPARECLAALFDRCFAAIRAQKPLYLLFSGAAVNSAYWEQAQQTADQIMKVLPETAFTGETGFRIRVIAPDSAGLYAPEDVADGSDEETPAEYSPLAGYYAGLVLGDTPEEHAEALLAAVQNRKPDMEPYQNIYALYYCGQEEQIAQDSERFWQYWRIIATRRGEQIYGPLNAILKDLPKPALLFLRQKQEEQKQRAAEKQAEQKREKCAEEGCTLLAKIQKHCADIQSRAETAARIAADEPDTALELLSEAEAAYADAMTAQEAISALGEPAADSAEQAAALLETAMAQLTEAKTAAAARKKKENRLETIAGVLQTMAEDFSASPIITIEEIEKQRDTVTEQLDLLSQETGAEAERLCRLAAHLLRQLDLAKKKRSEPHIQQEPPQKPVRLGIPQTQQTAQPVQASPVQQTVPVQQVKQVVHTPSAQQPAEQAAQKQAEQAVSAAIIRYREAQNACSQANGLDQELTAILRSMRSEVNAARSGAYRDRANLLMSHTVSAWNKSAAAAEEAAATAEHALQYPHAAHIQKQLQMMATEARNLSAQSGQRVRQIAALKTAPAPENKSATLMANAHAAYQAGHRLYLEQVQSALMTAHNAEKEAKEDGTPAAAMAQLLIVQRAYGQIVQIPEILRSYEERIQADTDAAMQNTPQVAREAETLRRGVQTDRKNTESVVSTVAEAVRRLTDMTQMSAQVQGGGNAPVPALPPSRDEMCSLLADMLPMLADACKKAMQKADPEWAAKKKLPPYPDLTGLSEGTLPGQKHLKHMQNTHEINVNGSFWEKYLQRFLSDQEIGTRQAESPAVAKYCGTLQFVHSQLLHWLWDIKAETLRINYGDSSAAMFCSANTDDAFYAMLWALAVFYQDDAALMEQLRTLPLYHKYFTQGCAAAFFGGKQGAERSKLCIFFALLHTGCILQLPLLCELLRMRSGFDEPHLRYARQLCRMLHCHEILDDVLYYGILQNGLDVNSYRLIRIWLYMDKLLQNEE